MWQTCGASVEFVISAGHGVAERPAPGGPLPAALLSQTHSNDFFVRCSLMKPHFVYRCAKFSKISISYHNTRHVVSTLRFRLFCLRAATLFTCNSLVSKIATGILFLHDWPGWALDHVGYPLRFSPTRFCFADCPIHCSTQIVLQ